jgi:hypothetical protein
LTRTLCKIDSIGRPKPVERQPSGLAAAFCPGEFQQSQIGIRSGHGQHGLYNAGLTASLRDALHEVLLT